MIVIGIDPGTHTGYAAWDMERKALAAVRTLKIHEAMDCVMQVHLSGMLHSVTFEDARLRKWHAKMDAEQAKYGAGVREGAGSIKRDCTIWADFLGAHGIAYKAIAPQKGATGWKPEQFAKAFGWTHRTSGHGRDAALLVVGR